VVVVVSAMSGETDRLIGLAKGIAPRPNPRELDVLMATGEQVTIALLCIALEKRGCPARSYTGGQVRILTDNAFNKARIEDVESDTMRADLDAGRVVVVAGFQGVDEDGNITTLGRGGSDPTGVALAAALKADELARLRQERLAAITLLANNQVFRELLTPLRQRDLGKWNERLSAWYDDQRVTFWLADTLENYHFISAEIIKPDGQPLISAGTSPYPQSLIRPVVTEVIASGQTALIDIQPGQDDSPYMAYAALIPDSGENQPLVLVFSVGIATQLLPLMDQWPNPSQTGKLLLFRQREAGIDLVNRP